MRHAINRSLLGSLGAVSGTTTYTTIFTPIHSFNSYMIQIAYTGTPTATVTLEVSADTTGNSWYDSTSGTMPQPVVFDTVANSSKSTASVNVLTYDTTASAGNWVRLKWVNASGTGTITSINFVAKGVST